MQTAYVLVLCCCVEGSRASVHCSVLGMPFLESIMKDSAGETNVALTEVLMVREASQGNDPKKLSRLTNTLRILDRN